VWEDGTKEWYQNGLRHREDDKPAFEGMIGHKRWYWPGVNVEKAWYRHGRLHRDDNKPTIIYSKFTLV
jgi:hypothetical protein